MHAGDILVRLDETLTRANLAIACKDPDKMADFYIKAFDFKLVRSNDGALAYGHHLSDGDPPE